MNDFEIGALDHLGIVVKNMEVSAAWYEKVLGLKRYDFPKWGEYPIFLLSGQTGVALFPSLEGAEFEAPTRHKIAIDHFAFRVSLENFEKARKRYDDLGLTYRFKDHSYYLSIYTRDPDGHEVELTAMTTEGKLFFEQYAK